MSHSHNNSEKIIFLLVCLDKLTSDFSQLHCTITDFVLYNNRNKRVHFSPNFNTNLAVFC